jgi:hypothetical protein
MLAIYQALVSHSRVYAVGGVQIRGKELVRRRMDHFLTDLREVSPKGGDLVHMTMKSLTIRSQREFGFVCGMDQGTAPGEITVLNMGSWFEVGDSILVLAGDEPGEDGDVWLELSVQTADTTAQCEAGPAQTLGIDGLEDGGPGIHVGAPVRAFELLTYGLFESEGGWFLGRGTNRAEDKQLLVGPLPGPDAATFRYLDRWGRETSTDTLVAEIEVSLRYDPTFGSGSGGLLSDSLVARVVPRN